MSKLFELEKTTVHAIVSKMIINEELMASLDEPTQCMVSSVETEKYSILHLLLGRCDDVLPGIVRLFHPISQGRSLNKAEPTALGREG